MASFSPSVGNNVSGRVCVLACSRVHTMHQSQIPPLLNRRLSKGHKEFDSGRMNFSGQLAHTDPHLFDVQNFDTATRGPTLLTRGSVDQSATVSCTLLLVGSQALTRNGLHDSQSRITQRPLPSPQTPTPFFCTFLIPDRLKQLHRRKSKSSSRNCLAK